MTPQRIQLSRRKGWRKPEGAVVVSRPSKWGNPYVLGAFVSPKAHPFFEDTVRDAAHAVELYERWLDGDPTVPLSGWNRNRRPPTFAEIRAELAGRDLCCWCPLDQACHADVQLRIANEFKPIPITSFGAHLRPGEINI